MNQYGTHIVAIPSYNTGAELLQRTVEDALSHWPHVWVFFDGSTDGSIEALTARKEELPGLQLFHSPQNQGKGAMAAWAAAEAHQHGVTHILLMDADGQHPAPAIPGFMAISQQNPDAMILGQPIFGKDAPWIRLAGRQLTNAMTWLETLGGGLGDTLFGFRVYPTLPLLQIFQQTRGGARRYDFDPEAAVRLYWNGVRPIKHPAEVRYLPPDDGGISHFHYLRDNLRMIALHLRLLPQLLPRLPSLCRRRLSATKATD